MDFFPGMGLNGFHEGEVVKLKVNALTSMKTLLPVSYYKLPFCKPGGRIRNNHENLGEFLSGDSISNSPYVLKMKKNTRCQQLCTVSFGYPFMKKKTVLSDADQNNRDVRRFMKKDYHINWLIDNLPPIARIQNEEGIETVGSHGFPIGYFDESDSPHIYNHVNIVLDYHEVEGLKNFFRVVKFSLDLLSIKHKSVKNAEGHTVINTPIASCADRSKQRTNYEMAKLAGPQRLSGDVLFTYDVEWKESDVSFAHRWDVYLHQTERDSTGVHWKAVINGFLIIMTLFFVITELLIRALKKDFARYNSVATEGEIEEAKEETGWKLLHADVFSPPEGVLFLSACVGTGVQILLMSVLTIFCALIGFASPNYRGRLVMALIFNYELMGLAAGFVAAQLYKTFTGKSYQKCAAATALGFPCIFFTVFFIMNITAVFYESTDAVPFLQILLLLFLWLCVSTPLVFLGAYFGNRMTIEIPVNTSTIPTKIQDQPWHMLKPFAFLIAGLIPFSACFLEMSFIFQSVWANFHYHFFYMLFFVLIILVLASVEISILHTYFLLCNEDHRWWWSSFFIGGSASIWFFLYSGYYFYTLRINVFATYILYFGYTFLASLSIFLFTGAAGFFGSLWFNKKIYGSIKQMV